jgi:ring-1,2-phenylacetyl-CoA epoxidase subunit PaaC
MFEADSIDREMAAAGIGADLDAIKPKWEAVVRDVLARATLSVPDDPPAMTGGRKGRHTEALGHLLSEMQIVARSHPGADW